MPDCNYCDASFEDESAYVEHLGEAHDDELSRIDRRRVDAAATDDDRSRLLLYGALGVVVLLLAAAVYVSTLAGDDGAVPVERQPLPDRGDEALLQDVERFPSEGRAHVDEGTPVEYDTRPPTSGPHYGRWADPGYYAEPVPAGNLVHSLEHGYVVIYYDPAALTPEAEESLRAFADAHGERWRAVVVVPNPAAEPRSPYVLTAWRTMLRLEAYNPAAVRAFLAEYLGRGPENPVR